MYKLENITLTRAVGYIHYYPLYMVYNTMYYSVNVIYAGMKSPNSGGGRLLIILTTFSSTNLHN